MSTSSSLVAKSPGSPVNANDACSIISWGFLRPRMRPVCGPLASIGIDREKVTPRRTAAAPRRTASASMRFSVPRWSSVPHRPQFETRAASARCSSFSGTGFRLLIRVLLAELVLEHLARRVARQHLDDLELLGDLLHHEPLGLA